MQIADIGLALVEQRRKVADAEVGIVRRVPADLGAQSKVAPHQRRHRDPSRWRDVVEVLAVHDDRPVRRHGVSRRVASAGEVAHGADLGSGCLVGTTLNRNGHASGHVVIPIAVQIGQDACPHQQHHSAVAMVLPHHRAAHFDQGGPQRVEGRDVELGGAVESAGGDGTRRRQHAVTADEFAGPVLPDEKMVAELVESIGVSSVGRADELEARFGGEHLVAQALRVFDECGIGGQQQCVARRVRRQRSSDQRR